MIIVLALLASASAAQRTDDRAALRQAKIEDWPGYYRRNDHKGLARFLADGFIHIEGDGTTETKAQAVEWVRTNQWTNAQNDFRYDIGEIVFYATDVANVYGVGSFNGRGSAEPCRMRYSSSNIFVRRSGRWHPIFSQTTKPACAPDASK